MKISEILKKEFKHAPTLGEFVDYITSEKCYEDTVDLVKNHKFNNTLEELSLYWIQEYNDFLKQPIELKMLVPCKDGEVLGEPKMVDPKGDILSHEERLEFYNKDCEDYQKAKEDVLFSGLEIKKRIGNTFTLRFEEDEFSQDYINWNDNAKEMSIITACNLDTFYECDTFETLEGLTGQPITDNYFKFLD